MLVGVCLPLAADYLAEGFLSLWSQFGSREDGIRLGFRRPLLLRYQVTAGIQSILFLPFGCLIRTWFLVLIPVIVGTFRGNQGRAFLIGDSEHIATVGTADILVGFNRKVTIGSGHERRGRSGSACHGVLSSCSCGVLSSSSGGLLSRWGLGNGNKLFKDV